MRTNETITGCSICWELSITYSITLAICRHLVIGKIMCHIGCHIHSIFMGTMAWNFTRPYGMMKFKAIATIGILRWYRTSYVFLFSPTGLMAGHKGKGHYRAMQPEGILSHCTGDLQGQFTYTGPLSLIMHLDFGALYPPSILCQLDTSIQLSLDVCQECTRNWKTHHKWAISEAPINQDINIRANPGEKMTQPFTLPWAYLFIY